MSDYIVIPINPVELALTAGKATELAQRCHARIGWLLPHLSTANVARDLDLLRQAVGEPHLSYVGYTERCRSVAPRANRASSLSP